MPCIVNFSWTTLKGKCIFACVVRTQQTFYAVLSRAILSPSNEIKSMTLVQLINNLKIGHTIKYKNTKCNCNSSDCIIS